MISTLGCKDKMIATTLKALNKKRSNVIQSLNIF